MYVSNKYISICIYAFAADKQLINNDLLLTYYWIFKEQ